jgi:hypothetical protein
MSVLNKAFLTQRAQSSRSLNLLNDPVLQMINFSADKFYESFFVSFIEDLAGYDRRGAFVVIFLAEIRVD